MRTSRCSCASPTARVRLGVLTDAGSITPAPLEQLQGCDALLLECNHDSRHARRIALSARPEARIGGRYGHLSNDTAAQILAACLHGGLRHVVAAHLSRENNRPELALAALAAGLRRASMRTCAWPRARHGASTGSNALSLQMQKAARGRLFRVSAAPGSMLRRYLGDYFEAGAAAAEAAAAAAVAAASAAEAAAVGAGAGAGVGGGSRSRRGHRGFFLLAAGSQSDGSNQGSQQKRLFHICPQSKGRTITGNCGTPPIPQSPNAQKDQVSSSLSVVQPAIICGSLLTARGSWPGTTSTRSLRNRINQLAQAQQIAGFARHRCRGNASGPSAAPPSSSEASSSVGISPASASSNARHSTTCDHCRRHSTQRAWRRTTSS